MFVKPKQINEQYEVSVKIIVKMNFCNKRTGTACKGTTKFNINMNLRSEVW